MKHWRFNDLTDKTFNLWTVIDYAGKTADRKSLWNCRCQCGTLRAVRSQDLTSGNSQSCGCIQSPLQDSTRQKVKTDGLIKSSYRSFREARLRCTDPRNKRYKDWGGRGIQFRFSSFEELIKEIGVKPSPGHSIDRIDNDGHYELGNVQWSTNQEQQHNTRYNRNFTFEGKTLTLSEWSRVTSIPLSTLAMRVTKRGWCFPCAVTLKSWSSCSHKPLATK